MSGTVLAGLIYGSFALPMVLLALYLLYKAFAGTGRVRAARGWPTTTGTIVSSSIQAYRTTSQTTGYMPDIVYEYSVGGQRYRSNILHFGDPHGMDAGRAQRKAMEYAVGQTVPVYYNPENPADAALELKAGGNWAYLLVAVILIAMTIGLLPIIMLVAPYL